MPVDEGVEFIQAPNTLKDKVSRRDDNEPDFSAAHDIIAGLSVEFELRLPGELAAIGAELEKLKQAPQDADQAKELFRRVHDLKGQAGTFNYMLITVVGNDWCRFIEHAKTITPRHLKVMDFFLDALNRVYKNKMKGDDPEGGQHIINTLHAMVQKVLQA